MEPLLPVPLNQNILLVQDALNNDIIQAIHNLYKTGLLQTRDYAKNFKAGSRMQTAKNVWDFMKRKITYKRDPNHKQMIRLPNRFVNDADGDCKSFALFAASILGNLGMPVTFRYAGYRDGSNIPTHVYMTTEDENGKEIIVDGVYRAFNKEKPYKFKKDYKMEVLALADDVSGIGKFRLPGRKFRRKFLKAHLKMMPKPLRKAALKQLKLAGKLTPMNKKLKNELFSSLSNNERSFRAGKLKYFLNNKLKSKIGEFDNDLGYLGDESTYADVSGIYGKKRKKKKKRGGFFKKIGKGIKKVAQVVKKVSLVPMRKSFQALVAVNFLALASKLKLAMIKKPGKVEKLWKKLGGNPNSLKKTIKRGSKKKPIFGKRPKGVRGIGTIEIEGIGAAPVAALMASAGTILAAFASILKGIKGGGGGGASEDAIIDEQLDSVVNDAGQKADSEVMTNLNQGNSYEAGANADNYKSEADQGNSDSGGGYADSDGEAESGGMDSSKMLLIGGAAIAAIMLMNKKK